MKARQAILMTLIILGCFLNAYGSSNNQYITELLTSAKQKHLWLNKEWLDLLHYKHAKQTSFIKTPANYFFKTSDNFASYVDDANFFLAKDGQSQPESELNATLTGMFDPVKLGDQHPQCRFPARYNWLVKHLGIDSSRLPKPDCPLFQGWQSMIKAKRVVLVFPAHHLNSPSSMFGHTLLRLDPAEDEVKTDWLSYGVNFGANVPANDNSLLYAYQGLTGGYPGQFIVEPYFKKIQEYNRIENRDIWEYPLNLTSEETVRLVTHLWELKEINFDYFFFTENCSYRLLELLEIARPSVELTDDFIVSAIPIDTIRSVKRGGLISDTLYRPAMATRLKAQLLTIPVRLHPLIAELSSNPKIAQQSAFKELPVAQQYQVLQAAYQSLRYSQVKTVRDQQAAKNSLALLSKISQYPLRVASAVPTPVSPENSHQSKRLAVKRGYENHKQYNEVEFRMAYHSLLDNRHGFLSGAQINMANMAFRYYRDDNIKLERFDAADIFSLTPKNVFFDQVSWRVYGGLERVQVEDKRPLAAHITGGGGYAYDLNHTTLFALLTARIEHNRYFKDPAEFALGTELGWLYHNKLGTGSVTGSGLEFSGNEQRLELNVAQDFVLSVNHALRLTAGRRWYDDHTASEISLGYHFFFR